MTFLTNEDFKGHAFAVFIKENSNNYEAIIMDTIESGNIALMKSKLGGRYDVAEIFEQSGSERHPLIVKILLALCTHDIIARNSARKMNSNVKDTYNFAKSWLNGVRDNKEHPEGLPPKKDENGNVEEKIMYGNNKNEDFYL